MIDHELDGARAMFGIVLTSICSSLVRNIRSKSFNMSEKERWRFESQIRLHVKSQRQQ